MTKKILLGTSDVMLKRFSSYVHVGHGRRGTATFGFKGNGKHLCFLHILNRLNDRFGSIHYKYARIHRLASCYGPKLVLFTSRWCWQVSRVNKYFTRCTVPVYYCPSSWGN